MPSTHSFILSCWAWCGPALCRLNTHNLLDSERMLLILRAHNKTRQIKERLRDTGCSTEVHSLKVMHCKIAFLLGGTFILCDRCRVTVSANRLGLCVGVTCIFLAGCFMVVHYKPLKYIELHNRSLLHLCVWLIYFIWIITFKRFTFWGMQVVCNVLFLFVSL